MSFDLNRVLIADDDERPRQLLAHYLKSWGFHVVACRDGEEAARILETDNGPALALIDWKMPGLEGVEICRRIRGRSGRHPYTYIILVTGESNAAAGLEAGADDFVTKPYNVDELRARLTVGQRVVGLERRLAEHIEMLRDALDQIGQLPEAGVSVCICPVCKRTRDDGQRWQPIETYLQEHVGTHSAHETCPDCQEKIQQQSRDADASRQPQAAASDGVAPTFPER